MFTDIELAAYLDEDLDAVQMAKIEQLLRSDPAILERLIKVRHGTLTGSHSLGAIWRKHHISCPTREQLGNFLLGIMPANEQTFVKTHIEIRGCRQCQANLDDLQQQQAEAQMMAQTRRTRYFQSSAGLLSQPCDQEEQK